MAWIKADTEIKPATPGGISTAWVRVDSAIATAVPGLVGGWIKADSQTKLVNPPGIPVCVPRTTKCVDYSLYTCSLAGIWVLTKHNATECGYVPEEKEKFPWVPVAVGGGILVIAIIASIKEDKYAK